MHNCISNTKSHTYIYDGGYTVALYYSVKQKALVHVNMFAAGLHSVGGEGKKGRERDKANLGVPFSELPLAIRLESSTENHTPTVADRHSSSCVLTTLQEN